MLFIGQLRQPTAVSRSASASRPQAGRRLFPLAVPAVVLACAISGSVHATPNGALNGASEDEAGAAQPAASEQLMNSPMLPAPDYSRKSDYELTRLGARWDELSGPQREALLREVKLRMAQRKDADGVLMIRTQRRYGRVYSGGGRYLKIETKVVRVRPAEAGAQTRGGFGTGYEQRHSATPVESPQKAAVTPPVVRVADP